MRCRQRSRTCFAGLAVLDDSSAACGVVSDLESLADRALSEGDVLTAAQALADAAWIANEEGMGGKTLTLSERARKLAMSPLISDEQREALEERFVGAAG